MNHVSSAAPHVHRPVRQFEQLHPFKRELDQSERWVAEDTLKREGQSLTVTRDVSDADFHYHEPYIRPEYRGKKLEVYEIHEKTPKIDSVIDEIESKAKTQSSIIAVDFGRTKLSDAQAIAAGERACRKVSELKILKVYRRSRMLRELIADEIRRKR